MEIWAGQDKPRKESPSSDRRSSVWSRKSPIPSLLYKYRCADAYTIALLKGQLYFAPPRDLNDPTELNLMYGADLQYEQRLQSLQSKVEAVRSDIERDRDRVQKHHWELYEKAFGDSGYGELDETGQTDDVTCEEDATFFRGVMHSTASRMSHQIEEQMRPLRREVEERAKKAEQTIEPVRSELSRLNKAWQQALGAYARQDMGLLCLSSEPDTYQMWSLYADGFRGVCVGFDTYRLTSALMTFGLDIIGPYWVKYRNLTFDDLLR
jgi:hypothetical protein